MSNPFDWPSLIASGSLGAVGGGVVSWIVAPHLKSREARGTRRVEARQAVRNVVGPELTKVRQYQARALGSLGRDADDAPFHAGDLTICARVLTASEGLPRWRGFLVNRRVKKLFGVATVELCDVHGDYANSPDAVLPILLNRQVQASRHPHLAQPDRGYFDRALRCEPESDEIANLLKLLKRLKESR